ncbi:HupE/UreJ family protein [Roseovarius sp. 2305UL8-3]|uniref:HupE/UreJ family protein n=1 Tax=Roseovarius conchicola TaxID=3121636 RepID=UPI003528399C
MKRFVPTFALIALAGPALAHTGHGTTSGFLHGLEHPVFGLDHLLAMLAVGLWSGFVLQSRVWRGAVTFLSMMGLGAALSWAGIGFPMVEGVITLSILAFGVLTVFSRRGQPAWLTSVSLAVIGFFAMAHGHAHATEAVSDAAGYLAGFLLSTAALHMIGIAIAQVLAKPVLQKALGTGLVLSGGALLAGIG